jgi:hypothetical protein
MSAGVSIIPNVSGKCQINKLIKFNKCQETRTMLNLKFKCLRVTNTKKSLIPVRSIKTRNGFASIYISSLGYRLGPQILLTLALANVAFFTHESSNKVIYGNSHRKEFNNLSKSVKKWWIVFKCCHSAETKKGGELRITGKCFLLKNKIDLSSFFRNVIFYINNSCIFWKRTL